MYWLNYIYINKTIGKSINYFNIIENIPNDNVKSTYVYQNKLKIIKIIQWKFYNWEIFRLETLISDSRMVKNGRQIIGQIVL